MLFQSAFGYFFYNVVFDFLTADEFHKIFRAFEGCNKFALTFRDSLTDYIFQIFRIILLMFGKNQLYAIAKGMRVFIGLSFLLLFIY